MWPSDPTRTPPSMWEDHVNMVSRVYQEANISAVLGPLLQAMTETHGNSPTFDNFPESDKTISQDQGGILLGILTEEDFFEENWTSWMD